MNIVSRLIQFKNSTNLTSSQFADKAGIPRPTLSQFLNGRNKRLSDDLIAKLHLAFPQLNVLWLLFGQGDMLVNENIEISEGKNGEISGGLFSQTPDSQANINPDISEIFVENFDQSGKIGDLGTEINEKRPNSVTNTHQSNISSVNITPVQVNTGEEYTQTAPQHQSTVLPHTDAPMVLSQLPTNPAKRIKYITVFYDDNSYEVFSRTGDAPE